MAAVHVLNLITNCMGRKYEDACVTNALARARFRREFLEADPRNKRKRVPYPEELGELEGFVKWFPSAIAEHGYGDGEDEALLRHLCTPPGS